MIELLAVGIGGFVGAVARHLLSGWVARLTAGTTLAGLPLGTLVVNVVGSFALGALLAQGERLPHETRLFVSVGVLGALTTFSTFSVESLELFRRDAPALALANLVGSVALGLGAAWLGLQLAGART